MLQHRGVAHSRLLTKLPHYTQQRYKWSELSNKGKGAELWTVLDFQKARIQWFSFTLTCFLMLQDPGFFVLLFCFVFLILNWIPVSLTYNVILVSGIQQFSTLLEAHDSTTLCITQHSWQVHSLIPITYFPQLPLVTPSLFSTVKSSFLGLPLFSPLCSFVS